MKRLRKIAFFIVMICVAVAGGEIVAKSAYAEGGKPAYEIGVSPTQKKIDELKPGESYTDVLKVHNTGTEEFDYEITYAPFSIANEKYDPSFSESTVYSDMKNWITIDKDSGHLSSGENEEIKYTITVPEDAHGGAQMAAIMLTMQNPKNNSGETAIETTRQLAFLVYGNVDGEITRSGKVLENKIPTFLFKPPITATSLVENTGNVYTNVSYELQVFPLFSDEAVYTNEENPDSSIIFPETKRFNQMSWDSAPQLGIFKVRQTVKIFDEESVVEKLVFLCPIWFLFIVLLIIFLVIFWIISRIVRRKKEVKE